MCENDDEFVDTEDEQLCWRGSTEGGMDSFATGSFQQSAVFRDQIGWKWFRRGKYTYDIAVMSEQVLPVFPTGSDGWPQIITCRLFPLGKLVISLWESAESMVISPNTLYHGLLNPQGLRDGYFPAWISARPKRSRRKWSTRNPLGTKPLIFQSVAQHDKQANRIKQAPF